MKKGVIPGVILIAVGAYFLLEQIAVFPDGVGLALVGAALLVLRKLRGGYGFTIAGCIALAVGISHVLDDAWLFRILPWRDSVPLFLLAAAFVAIYLIEHRRRIIWPLIPALCLACAGVLFAVGGDARLYSYWPVLLICAGAAMLAGAFGRAKAKYRGPDTPPAEQPIEAREPGEEEEKKP